MKAWRLLLLGMGWGIGACADPPRRPPTTYVPLATASEAAALPPGPLESIAGPLGQDPSASPTPASSKSAASGEKPERTPGSDPANDKMCFRSKNEGTCCTEPGFKPKKQGNKTICPTGTFLGAKCAKIGKTCQP